jgi:hypothetical protein
MQSQPNNRLSNAIVLGNGKSRLNIKLNGLKSFSTIYGCNALYRDFTPDHLIAVDAKMINEIIKTDYQKENLVWTNHNKLIENTEYLNFLPQHRGWSSGPTALWLACLNNHLTIYIIGFDFYGIDGLVNNVYAGTFNYKQEHEPATFFGNWLFQTNQIIIDYPYVNFIIVGNDKLPDNMLSHTNLMLMSIGDFNKIAINP